MIIQKKLDCGVTLVAEPLKNFRSVTVGIWVGAGSITESSQENGISHFIEHMLFKGTEKRSAKQIAIDVDSIGGQVNAFTSKECTCYYIKSIDEKMEDAIEILTDFFCNAVLDEEEMEKEKGVVLEEIAMNNDTPEDVASDLVAKVFFDTCSLEKTILGPPENICSFSRGDLKSYMKRYYTAENIVVAVAGNFEEERLTDCLNKYLSNVNTAALHVPEFAKCNTFSTKKNFATVQKDIEQVHIWLAMPGVNIGEKRKYALNIFNNILGGSMSSRLFQKIREEMGLVYTVFSHPVMYRDTGMLGVYAGTTYKNAQTVTELVIQELSALKKSGATKEEFVQSKAQLKGSLVLALESTSAKMNSLGKSMTLTGRVYTDDEILQFLEDVTYEDMQSIIDEIVVSHLLSGAYVGKIENEQALKSMIDGAAF
ncbi:MAG: M16 family metallopeptidase [Christensenellaceae bacterium]|jgi:predicted Zn-dependent peptidase